MIVYYVWGSNKFSWGYVDNHREPDQGLRCSICLACRICISNLCVQFRFVYTAPMPMPMPVGRVHVVL